MGWGVVLPSITPILNDWKRRALMRKLCLAMLLSMVCSGNSVAQEVETDRKPETVSTFMRAKLLHSQKLIEALALEDFDQLAKHSQEMSLLSNATLWQVFQTPEYLQHSTEFRRTADSLTEAAKKKNLDGAALAYVELTLKCVQCHKYVRRTKMAELPKPMLPKR